MGVLFKGTVRQTGEGVDHRGSWGSHIRSLHLIVTLQTFNQGLCLQEEASVILRSTQAFQPNKMNAKAGIPWRSLARLLIHARTETDTNTQL